MVLLVLTLYAAGFSSGFRDRGESPCWTPGEATTQGMFLVRVHLHEELGGQPCVCSPEAHRPYQEARVSGCSGLTCLLLVLHFQAPLLASFHASEAGDVLWQL